MQHPPTLYLSNKIANPPPQKMILPTLLLLSLLPQSFSLSTPSPLSQLSSLQADLLASIAAQIPLQATDFTEVMGGAAGAAGASWLTESSPNYLTGVSSSVTALGAVSTCAVNCWMGPSYDPPHSLLSFSFDSGTGLYGLSCDYVPRGPLPLGSDPALIEK